MQRLWMLVVIPMVLSADWSPSLETIGQVGNYRKGGGALVFSPVGQDGCSLLFGQAHAGIFRELYVGSLGLGYRRQAEAGHYSWGHYFAWGINAFFDVARSNSDRVYYQGSIGGELLGDCWLARANGYWPSRNLHIVDTRRESNVFVNGTAILSTDNFFDNVEVGYHGFDIEVGRGWQVGCGQLWGYAGYYFFDAHKVHQQQGPRLRAEYTLDQTIEWCPLEITAGAEWEHNKRHGSTVSGYLSVRIPFDNTHRSSSCCEGICRLMGDPVFRNKAIWVDREVVLSDWPITTQIGNIFFADATGGGNGSQASPVTIAVADASTGPGDVIFCLADNSTITVGATVGLDSQQQLWSFGPAGRADIALGPGRTLTVTPLSGASTRAATLESSVDPMCNCGRNVVVGGIILDGDDNDIILQSVAISDDFQIFSSALMDAADEAVNATGAGESLVGCTVHNCAFENTEIALNIAGIDQLGATQRVVVRRTSFDDLDSEAILAGLLNQDSHVECRGCVMTGGFSSDIIIDVVPASVSVLVDDCTFDDTIGLRIETNDVRAGGRAQLAALNNRGGQSIPVNGGILIFNSSDPTGGLVRGKNIVARNQVVLDPGSTDFAIRCDNGFFMANEQLDVFVTENNTVSAANSNNIRIRNLEPSSTSATVTNNTDLGDSSLLVDIDNFTTAPRCCGTIAGNRSPIANGVINLDNSSGTMQITNDQTLGPLNSGAPITRTPPITDTVIPCQLP